MSYILDALKKADAEREQGQVPGLHTPVPYAAPKPHHLARSPWPWVIAAGVAVAGLGLGATWWWPRTVAVTAASSAAPGAAMPHVASAQPVVSTAQAPSPAPSAATPPPAAIEPPPRPPAEVKPVVPATRTPPRPVANEPATQPAGRAPIHVDPAPPSSAKVPTLAELPDEVRRNLPALSVSGAMYSDHPANRMLLVNNRVFHEGDQPAAGLVLEEIRLKSAVFRYRGTRYAVSY